MEERRGWLQMKRPAEKRSSQRGEDSDWGKGRTGWCAGGLGLCACFENRPGDGRAQVSGEQSNAHPPQKVHVYVIVAFSLAALGLVSAACRGAETVALHHRAAWRRSSERRRRGDGRAWRAHFSHLHGDRSFFKTRPARELVWLGPTSRRALASSFCFLRGTRKALRDAADVGMAVISLITAVRMDMDCDPSYAPRNLY